MTARQNIIVLLSFVKLLILQLIGGERIQPVKIAPGNTPGVKTPGDISYFNERCLESPKLLLQQGVRLGNKEPMRLKFTHSPSVIRQSQGTKLRKRRPPAWKAPHLSNSDIDKIDDMALFFLNRSNFCPFFSKDCLIPGKEYKRKKDESPVRLSLHEWEALPQIGEESWGSCAFVGLGDNLLRQRKGKEIDSHDVVIRLGEPPLVEFKSYVGLKTDATWIRRRAKMAPRGYVSDERKNVKWYFERSNGVDIPVLRTALLFDSNSPTFTPFHTFLYETVKVKKWDKFARKETSRSPSTGFKAALALMFSHYCKRLDIYGLSLNCGGAYYNTNHLMQTKHNCELESWFLHHAMRHLEEFQTCVYL